MYVLGRHGKRIDVIQWLETQTEIESVKYPFCLTPAIRLAKKKCPQGGGVITFVVKGGLDRGRKFLDSLELFSHTVNLGDCRPSPHIRRHLPPIQNRGKVREAASIFDYKFALLSV